MPDKKSKPPLFQEEHAPSWQQSSNAMVDDMAINALNHKAAERACNRGIAAHNKSARSFKATNEVFLRKFKFVSTCMHYQSLIWSFRLSGSTRDLLLYFQTSKFGQTRT